MSKCTIAEKKAEIDRGFQFLATLTQHGKVYSTLLPILNDLKNEAECEEIQQQTSADGVSASAMVGDKAPSRQDYESIFIAFHKAMCEEKFICIVEKPSTVPGFAPALRELLSHQLPDGWNADPTSYSLMYRHRQKPGKQFMLTCSVLMDGAIINAIVTEKNGLSLGVELDVEELSQPSLTKEGLEAALKTQVQALVWQIIPQLAVTPIAPTPMSSTSNNSDQSSIRAPPSVPVAAYPTNPYFDPYSDGRGGFIPTPMVPPVGGYIPRFPGVGGGDLHPSFPGVPPQAVPDFGQGSLVGPNHPLFNPNMGGYPTDPRAPPGWPAGMPRPRFDSFGPIPGPNGPNFGQIGPGFGPNGGRGTRRRVPGEPNPDHFMPPGDGDDGYI